MTIPVATTTIRVERAVSVALGQQVDPYDDAVPGPAGQALVIAEGVRAVFSRIRGADSEDGGQRSVVEAELRCDPVDILSLDTVVDEATGERWSIRSVQTAGSASGRLTHVKAPVFRVIGEI